MPNNANNIVVAGSGKVYIAVTTTVAPTNYTTALNAAFLAGELGFISDEGATFTEGRDIVDINVWQSLYPARKLETGRTVDISFAVREFNKRAVEFALGGTVAVNAAEWKYTPPAAGTVNLKSMVMEWTDGSKGYRLYVPTGLVTAPVETALTRTAAADLPITFSATDPGTGVSIYTLFTTDVAFSS